MTSSTTKIAKLIGMGFIGIAIAPLLPMFLLMHLVAWASADTKEGSVPVKQPAQLDGKSGSVANLSLAG